MDENLSRGYVRLSRPPYGSSRDNLATYRNSAHVSPPVDEFNYIYAAMVLAGVGFLLPYNSFTIAVDYYTQEYPHTNIIYDMSIVYIVMAFFAVLANNFLVETFSLNTRITFGYGISCVTLLFVAIGEIWLGLGGSQAGYTINLIAVAVVSLGCTIQQASFYGYTSMLPSRYTQAVMAGESAAGFLVSINRIITKSMWHDVKVQTFTFFSLSVSIVATCYFTHHIVSRTKFVQFYFAICRERKKLVLEPSEDHSLMESTEADYGVLRLQSPVENSGHQNPLSFANPAYEPQATSAPTPSYKVEDIIPSPGSRRPGRWRGMQKGLQARWEVSKSIWPYMLTIAVAYFVTLCLYPGIMSEIVSCHFNSWMPVVIMALFNGADLFGKILAAISNDWSSNSMIVVAGCRVFLIPLLLLCAMPREHAFISGEGYPMFFSMLLGLTNGLVGSIPMIQAPYKVKEEHRELAGNIMTLSYNVGLTAGSIAAYTLKGMIGPRLDDVCDGFLPIPRPPNGTTPLLTTAATATTWLVSALNVTTSGVTNLDTTPYGPVSTLVTPLANATLS